MEIDYVRRRLTGTTEVEYLRAYGEEDIHLEIALALVAARKAAGVSRRDLASLTNLPVSALAKIERGEADPTISCMGLLFAHLGLRLKVTTAPLPFLHE